MGVQVRGVCRSVVLEIVVGVVDFVHGDGVEEFLQGFPYELFVVGEVLEGAVGEDADDIVELRVLVDGVEHAADVVGVDLPDVGEADFLGDVIVVDDVLLDGVDHSGVELGVGLVGLVGVCHVVGVHFAEEVEDQVLDGGAVSLDVVHEGVLGVLGDRVLVREEGGDDLVDVFLIDVFQVVGDGQGGQQGVVVEGVQGIGHGEHLHFVMDAVRDNFHHDLGAFPVDLAEAVDGQFHHVCFGTLVAFVHDGEGEHAVHVGLASENCCVGGTGN